MEIQSKAKSPSSKWRGVRYWNALNKSLVVKPEIV
jgi:hypothetical protein